MNELEKLMARMVELEKVAERSEEQNSELGKAKTRVAELEKERDDASDQTVKKLAEMERKEAIRAVADQFDVEKALTRTFVSDSSKSVQDFKDALLEKRMAETPSVPGNVLSEDGRKDMLRAIEDSLVLRLGGAVKDAHKDMDNFRGATLIDIARAVTGESGYNNEQIAERAMVTADFPNLLLGAGNRVLMSEFEAAGASYKGFVVEVDVPDFRTNREKLRNGHR